MLGRVSERLVTENHQDNAPMLSINRRLGFVFDAPEVVCVKWLHYRGEQERPPEAGVELHGADGRDPGDRPKLIPQTTAEVPCPQEPAGRRYLTRPGPVSRFGLAIVPTGWSDP
jgi:hypothetical protein